MPETAPPLESLASGRETLHALGLPADDLEDVAIMREMRLRAMAETIGRCRLQPGTTKRFVRNLPTFRWPITPRQEAFVTLLWHRFRCQLRDRKAADPAAWLCLGLPDVPGG